MGDLRKHMIFWLNGGFAKRKRVIFAYMGIWEEKMRVFRLNGGFAKTRDFRVKWKIPEEKMRDFCLNGGFVKRKRVFFT